MNIGELILAAVAGGVFTKIIDLIVGRHKMRADAAKIITEAAGEVVGQLTGRVQTLENEVTKLKRQLGRYAQRVIYLMAGIEKLTHQIVANGETPCWTPDEWIPELEAEVDERAGR